jgi:hypothetical protein
VRMVLTATMAASVLAIGLNPAQALPLGGKTAAPDAVIENAQQKEMSPGPGQGSPGMGSPGMGSPGMGSPGMGSTGMGTQRQGAQGQGGQGQGSRAQGSQGQGGQAMGPGEGGGGRMRGEGPQFRSGERGGYGYGPRNGQRGERLGERGPRGGVIIGREHDRGQMRRHFGYREFGGPRYGYGGDCSWLRRRALDTGSGYWWRRYRDCMH